MDKRPPISLLAEEGNLLRRLAKVEGRTPGEVVRRLIILEAARLGLLERGSKEEWEEV